MSDMNEDSIRDTARAAALVIRERGLYKMGGYSRSSITGDGPVCLLGAVAVATDGHPWLCFYQPNRDIHVAIGARCERLVYGDVDRSISRWNDAASTSAADVIALLERVAAGEGASP